MSERILLSALRRDDLLALEFELVNLQLSAGGELVRIDNNAPAVIVVHFWPQHLAEQIFPPPPPPIRTILAGGSRLAFQLPDEISSLPSTLDALLNWAGWLPALAPGALPRGAPVPSDQPAPAPPGELETAIEFPWRLLLSPDRTEVWRHDLAPLTLDGNTQLWRTYLGLKGDRGPSSGRFSLPNLADLRGLWDISGEEPVPTSLPEKNRHNIVRLSSDYGIPITTDANGPKYTPLPVRAEEFSLSTLGATGRLDGKWEFPLVAGLREPPDLQQYRHVAAQGRDHFVRTVNVGFLCGTGNRATIVVTTERLHSNLQTVGTTPNGFPLIGATAYLLQTKEVVVQEPEIDYGTLAPGYAFRGREMPLRSIRLLTTSATVIGDPELTPSWLMTAPGTPLMFKALATDIEGNTIEFALPLMFVSYSALGTQMMLGAFQSFRNPPPEIGAKAHTIDLGNQELAFAPKEKPGSTTLRTVSFTYDIETTDNGDPAGTLNPSDLPPTYVPPFAPRIMRASATVPAVNEIIGGGRPIEFAFDKLYLQHDFDPSANRGQSFVRFTSPLALEFGSQRGGGLARPNSAADGLSRTLGPVSRPDELAAGNVDFSAIAPSARFLGTIKLSDIIPQRIVSDSASVAADPPTQAQLDDPNFRLNAPRLTTRRLPGGDAIETRFLWKPELKPYSLGIFTLQVTGADLLLDARMTRSPSGGGSAVTLGRMRNPTLDFAGAISVHFEELTFRSEEGKKLEVGAKGANLMFAGPLSFVNSLQSILPSDGFDDPPFVTVDGQGVVAGYTLGVPSIGVGIFSLQNIALSAALSVPFTDRPAGVRFSVSERHKPFLLTVSLFGGGGFFAMAVSANGLEQVEASIEFGGNISLNLVIASGGVFVMAGIYFGLTGTSVTLTGYLRCGGSLEVLGLISISVEFYLGFTYRHKDGGGSEVWGQASLVVCVKIAFFSKSVSLSVERRFAGSDGDPSFSESVTPRDWVDYLLSFAQ